MFITESIRWLFVNGILALLPLLIAFFISFLANADVKWYQMLKEGELYVFSTTLCATSIGTIVFEKKASLNRSNLLELDTEAGVMFHTIVMCILILILITSTSAFAMASFTKLNRHPSLPEKRFSKISVCCALLTILLGYFTFTLTN